MPSTARKSHPAIFRGPTLVSSSTSSNTKRQGCPVCRRPYCDLPTHREYAKKIYPRQVRRPDMSFLMRTPFAYSYVFNPLAVAIHYVCGQIDANSCPEVLGDNLSLSHCLHKFIEEGIRLNIPFIDPSGPCDVAAQWLMAAAADELACTSTLLLWTIIEQRKTNDSKLDHFASRLTALFLEELRNRVESGGVISVGTIFAASNHLAIVSMYFEQTVEERDVMMRGLEALVNQVGGLEKIDEAQTGLLQSLLWSDVLHSWNTGDRPRFQLDRPVRPPAALLPELKDCSNIPAPYLQCCSPDLLDSAKHLKFFLLFRHSTAVRPLSKVEYCYVVELERYIHVQLLEQQARYHLTNTISECLVLAMAIVRMTVLCVWDQHVQIRQTHVRRLSRALEAVPYNTWSDSDTAYPLLWICWVILAQAEICYDQEMVLSLISRPLRSILGNDHQEWPADWSDGFLSSFMPLMWHSDYSLSLRKVAMMIENFLLIKEHGSDIQ